MRLPFGCRYVNANITNTKKHSEAGKRTKTLADASRRHKNWQKAFGNLFGPPNAEVIYTIAKLCGTKKA